MPGKKCLITLAVALGLVFATFLIGLSDPIAVAAQDVTTQQSNETLNQLWATGEPIGLFGPFNYSDQNITGKFVRFSFDQNSSAISNYSVSNSTGLVTVFNEIIFSGLGGNSTIALNGPLFEIDGNTTGILAHNNPTGLMQIISVNSTATINFSLASGMNASVGTSKNVMNVSGAGLNGTILAFNGTITNGSSSGQENIYVNLGRDGAVQFRCSPKVQSIGDNEERLIQSAFAMGNLGGEGWVTINGSSYIYEDASTGGIMPHVASASEGQLIVQLNFSSAESIGHLVVMNVDQRIVNSSSIAAVILENQTVAKAESFEAVMNATSENATYFALDAQNITKFVINLPASNGTQEMVISGSGSAQGTAPLGIASLPLVFLTTIFLIILIRSAAKSREEPLEEER